MNKVEKSQKKGKWLESLKKYCPNPLNSWEAWEYGTQTHFLRPVQEEDQVPSSEAGEKLSG